MIKLVIFDFDGVIVDSKTVYYNSINKHLNPLGFNKKEVDKAIDLGMNLSETLKRFIPAFFYRWWIKRNIMKDVVKEINDVKKCKDISHVKDITARKVLISNSLSGFVFPVLKHLNATRYFNEIYCADEFNDKERFIREYLKEKGINPHECAYVGDRVADVKLARRLGIYVIIISGKCMWDSPKEIMKAKPDFIVNDLIDVNRILKHIKD